MFRVQRLLFFIKRMMERMFTVTIATNSAVNKETQMMHSDKEKIILLWVISSLVLLFLEFVLPATVTWKNNKLWSVKEIARNSSPKLEEFAICQKYRHWAAKLFDYWTVNQEDLVTRLSCFGSDHEYKIVAHFTSVTRKKQTKCWLKT